MHHGAVLIKFTGHYLWCFSLAVLIKLNVIYMSSICHQIWMTTLVYIDVASKVSPLQEKGPQYRADMAKSEIVATGLT
jgi:hypothetical protein